jgi:hypothetical protein
MLPELVFEKAKICPTARSGWRGKRLARLLPVHDPLVRAAGSADRHVCLAQTGYKGEYIFHTAQTYRQQVQVIIQGNICKRSLTCCWIDSKVGSVCAEHAFFPFEFSAKLSSVQAKKLDNQAEHILDILVWILPSNCYQLYYNCKHCKPAGQVFPISKPGYSRQHKTRCYSRRLTCHEIITM